MNSHIEDCLIKINGCLIQVDVAILEVGLGGKFDATNVVCIIHINLE